VNQVRATEISSLAGLNQLTGVQGVTNDDNYISTDDRELAVWQQMLSQQRGIGEEIDYSDELAEMRNDL
jgi:phenylalanine-4-hydroxylase